MSQRRDMLFSVVVPVIVFSTIYYFFFARQFLRGDIVMGGDTQVLWSFNYLVLHSLKSFGEFPWWDPTVFNGWPAYVNFTSGWFNYLGPYSLPPIAAFAVGSLFFNIDVNNFLVLQKTLYYFVLNAIAVALISREVIFDRYARVLPLLIFSLSAIQFHGFRDSVLYEAMPGPLFFVFGLIYYNNRRTPTALLFLVFVTALFAASLNYATLQTSLWWTLLFSLFLIGFNARLPIVTLRNVVLLYDDPRGRTAFLLLTILILAGCATFYIPIHFNLGELVRVLGTGIVDYNVGVDGGVPPEFTLSHPIWANFLYWSPFEVIHDYFLRFDEKGQGQTAGVDHRYIGLATLPLLIVAIFRGHRAPYLPVLLLATFACVAFVAYTSRNLLIAGLAETMPLFKNIRTISDTLPRDAPIIFLALAAGIGLDLMIRAEPDPRRFRRTESTEDLMRWLLRALMLFAVAILLVAYLPVLPFAKESVARSLFPTFQDVQLPQLKEAAAHVGVYLFLFTLLCLLMTTVRDVKHRASIAAVVLILTFFDLTISSSSYWERGKVWFHNAGPHALPKTEPILPVSSTLENWPGSYGGFIHNSFMGPLMGLRSWLVLSTRPQWQSVLENYDPESRIMKAYPDFRFFSRAENIPFTAIEQIESVGVPSVKSGQLYVHGTTLGKAESSERLHAQWQIRLLTQNRVEVDVIMPKDGVMLFLDNYDRFWSSNVDGRAAKVHRANFTFKAIELSAGSHKVEWIYNPYPVKIAWMIFYFGLLVTLLHVLGSSLNRSVRLAIGGLAIFLASILVVGWLLAGRGALSAAKIDASRDRILLKGGAEILRLAGKEHPIVKGTAGFVEGVFLDGSGMSTVLGWSIDEVAAQPPLTVAIAIGNIVWASGAPSVERPDIAALNHGYRRSGFRVHGRGGSKSDHAELRAFAILANGRAVELGYSDGIRHGAAAGERSR